MLNQLPVLKKAVFGEAETGDASELSWERYLAVFNQQLTDFFTGKDYDNILKAAKKLGQLLTEHIGLLADEGDEVVQIFEAIIANALAQASTWDFKMDVERYHQQGRQLAQKFYQHSCFDGIKKKLSKSAEVVLEYGNSVSFGRPTNVNLTLGYKAAPAATYHIRKSAGVDEGETIVFRVSYDNDFSLYLLYPFLFLHEYTAHIFANDFKNAVFNDGWMLFAASEFLISDWQNSVDDHLLDDEQVYIFREAFSGRLGNNSRRGYDSAYRLASWMEKNSHAMTFESITNELAAFVPTAEEKNFWPTQFINMLERNFLTNRPTLAAKLKVAKTLRMLHGSLKH